MGARPSASNSRLSAWANCSPVDPEVTEVTRPLRSSAARMRNGLPRSTIR